MLEIFFFVLLLPIGRKRISPSILVFDQKKRGSYLFPPNFYFLPAAHFPHFLLFSRESYFHKILEEEEEEEVKKN